MAGQGFGFGDETMKEVLDILQAIRGHPSRAALATLVSVEGSSYRRAGARMLWRADGPRVGGISGGCLEEDLAGHCRAVAACGVPRVVAYDTRDENDLVWGTGTGCSGVVRVLVEPVRGMPAALAFARDAWARREAAVLVTRFSAAGGGTVFALSEGGAVWERDRLPRGWRAAAGECLRAQKPATRKAGHGVRLFFEYMPPPVSLVVFGGGDDTRPLVRMARALGWLAEAHDAHARFPTADARRAVIVMTHCFARDAELLRLLLPGIGDFAYAGLLGPRARTEKLLRELEGTGVPVSRAARARLHAPVGLDLGGDTPETVALSVLAEIQSVLSGRKGGPLRKKKGAIHDG